MIKKVNFKEAHTLQKHIVNQLHRDPDSKFSFALKETTDSFLLAREDYNKDLLNKQLEHALEKDGMVVLSKDPNNIRPFEYSKDGLKACIEAERLLDAEWEVKEIEIDVFTVKAFPKNIDDYTRKHLAIMLDK